MKLSVLFKATSVGIISFNLAMLPILLPISAQTKTTSSGSSTGSGNTSDPNINPTTSNSTTPNSSTESTGASTTPSGSPSANDNSSGNMISGATTTPSNSTSGDSTNSGTSSTGSASSDPTTGASSAPSTDSASPSTGSSPTSSETNTTSERGSSSLGWLGLLGLIGLASLFRKPANNQHLQTRFNSANDHIEQGVAQAGEGLGNFIGELKTDVNDFKERRAKAKEIKQIKNALGRPSNRVILDRQDNVVLNVGDLITNQAIERARSADMLDVLLDSVDEQTPAIDDEERSAPVPGEASLEEQDGTTTSNHRL